jgi:hypothetical protein
VLTIISPVLVGPKWTLVLKKKQAAVNLANLLQQEPQAEVTEQKLSAVSSDEEKLAAGISTIGLQAKTLSGAQRRRLMREEKMREGTWREKRPPRKTPSPQDEGAEGSSGGVKRPHSDSSTPYQEKQLPKKPRNTQVQTGTFKEAVLGIKMVIIHKRHPDVKLELTQVDVIQKRLLNAVDRTPSGETPPQFLYSSTGTILDYLRK